MKRTETTHEAAPATRNTIQRTLVLEAVRALHEHPTSADVYDAVCVKYPNISRATVYRNLSLLAERGEVLRVEVPNGADRYDFFTEPHYHAKCTQCKGVFDIALPYDSGLIGQIEDTHGFEITSYQIIFEGICPACKEGGDR